MVMITPSVVEGLAAGIADMLYCKMINMELRGHVIDGTEGGFV